MVSVSIGLYSWLCEFLCKAVFQSPAQGCISLTAGVLGAQRAFRLSVNHTGSACLRLLLSLKLGSHLGLKMKDICETQGFPKNSVSGKALGQRNQVPRAGGRRGRAASLLRRLLASLDFRPP